MLLNIGAQSPTIAGIGKFTFSMLQLANFDVGVLAKYACDTMKLRKVALFYVSDDTGKFDQSEFAKDFTALGGAINAHESFRPSEINYGSQVAKIAASRPDCVYLIGQPADLPFAVRQLRAPMGDTPILSFTGIESREFLNAAGNVGNGIVYPTTFFDPASTDQAAQKFVATYRQSYGQSPASPYIGYGYDAVRILATALATPSSRARSCARRSLARGAAGARGLPSGTAFRLFPVLEERQGTAAGARS